MSRGGGHNIVFYVHFGEHQSDVGEDVTRCYFLSFFNSSNVKEANVRIGAVGNGGWGRDRLVAVWRSGSWETENNYH